MGRLSPPTGKRNYRGKASECSRTFAGFVGLRGGICQPNPRRRRRPVNEAAKHPSGGRTYRGRAGECPRRFAGFAGLQSDIGSRRGFGSAKGAVRGWLKRFSTEKTHTPQGTNLARQEPGNGAVKHPSGGRTYGGRAGECPRTFAGFVGLRGGIYQPNPQRGRRPVNEAAKHPSGGRTYRGRAGECPRRFAGFAGLQSDIGSRRGFGSAKGAVRGWLKRFSTEKNTPPREQIWQGKGDFNCF